MGGLRHLLPLATAAGCHFDAAGPVHDGPPAGDASFDGMRDSPDGVCPASYVHLGTQVHRYRFVTLASDWVSLKTTCAADGGYLAIPDSADELTALAGFAGTAPQVWIGISDQATDGIYLTVKDTAQTFLPWATGQPAPEPPAKDCVEIVTTMAELATETCAVLQDAICECDSPLP